MVEIQKGLYLETKTKFIMGKYVEMRRLFSKDGYCFYSKQEKKQCEEWDGEEEFRPKLIYKKEAFLGINDLIENYVSVVVQDDFEIV